MLSTSTRELEAILVVSNSRKSFWELCYWSRRRRLIIITGSPLVACLVHQSRNSNVGMILRLKFEGFKIVHSFIQSVPNPLFSVFTTVWPNGKVHCSGQILKSGNCGIIRQGCHKSTWITIKCCSKTNYTVQWSHPTDAYNVQCSIHPLYYNHVKTTSFLWFRLCGIVEDRES